MGGWRKSNHSNANGCVEWHRCESNSCVEVGVARISSHTTNGSCVEVEGLPEGWVAVRDSKDRAGPVLRFNPEEWQAFLAGVRDHEFDLA